jgi:hypothetical protein
MGQISDLPRPKFVIGGYTPDHSLDGLIIGYYEGDKLYYVANVRNGFVPEVRREVYRKFKGLEIDTRSIGHRATACAWQPIDKFRELRSFTWARPPMTAFYSLAPVAVCERAHPRLNVDRCRVGCELALLVAALRRWANRGFLN